MEKEKKKKKKKKNEVDKISDLPDSILHHIFSFLNIEEAVRSSVYSKRWRDLWISLPTLNFEYDFYDDIDQYHKIMCLVYEVFILRDCSHIQRFCFICPQVPDSPVNTWIVSALRRNLQELVLETLFENNLPLPTCLFNSKSLTLLKLVSHDSCNYFTLPLPDSACLPSLKTLFLESIDFDDEYRVNNFFSSSSCPVLESLTITDCSFRPINIKISSLSLKHLIIQDIHGATNILSSGSVKLKTPNLISFRCRDYMGRKYYLEDISSLIKVEICMIQRDEHMPPDDKMKKRMLTFLGACCNVEDLTLSATILEVVSGDPDHLGSLTSKFCNLKHLKLKISLSMDNIHAVTYLLKISPVIESIFLKISKVRLSSTNVGDYLEEELLMDFSLDHLKLVEIRGLVGCAIELNFLEILLKNAMTMEKLVVFTSKKDSSPGRERQLMKFSEKLLAFPRASASTGFLFF